MLAAQVPLAQRFSRATSWPKMGFAPRKNQTKCFRGEEKLLLKVSYDHGDLSIINPSHIARRLVR
jgi:hypothetical protein